MISASIAERCDLLRTFESSKIILYVNVLITDFKWPHLIEFSLHFQTMYRKLQLHFRICHLSRSFALLSTTSKCDVAIWPMLWYKSKCGVSHLIKHETTQSPFLWWLRLNTNFEKKSTIVKETYMTFRNLSIYTSMYYVHGNTK